MNSDWDLMKFPCKECKKRYLGCHDSCQEYLAVKKKQDEFRKKEKQNTINRSMNELRHPKK